MISILGRTHRNCDGVSRREFLTAGAMGLGGLTLAGLLRAEAAEGIGSSQKAVINVHLDGGPPQMDMIDPKPSAPLEIRGPFQPIATSVPGIHVSDLLPKVGSIADRLVFVRSLVGSVGRHDAFQCMSGYDDKSLAAFGGRPAMGCVLSRLLGSSADSAPTFVDLMQGRPLVRNSARPGFIGPSYKPFRPDISAMFARPLEAGMVNELSRQGANHTVSLSLQGELDARRLGERKYLRERLDSIRRNVDSTGMMDAVDRFTEQATSILTSGAFADALDLEKIDRRELEMYTAASSGLERFTTAEDEFSMRKLLLARRLIEVGVRCVTVSFSDFDTHTDNFGRMRQMLPILDHGLHALITDLEQRGMLGDVSIVLWGEFGRTPKVNAKGGRDHWPAVGMAMLTGGGMQGGQVIGATDRIAGTATLRPVQYQDVMATLYRNLGIDASTATLVDPSGRPQRILDIGEPLSEVV